MMMLVAGLILRRLSDLHRPDDVGRKRAHERRIGFGEAVEDDDDQEREREKKKNEPREPMTAQNDARTPQDEQDRPKRNDRIPEGVGDEAHCVQECDHTNEEQDHPEEHSATMMTIVVPIAPLCPPLLPALLDVFAVVLLPLVFALTPLFFCLGFVTAIHLRTKDMHVRAALLAPPTVRLGLGVILLPLVIFFIHIPIIPPIFYSQER